MGNQVYYETSYRFKWGIGFLIEFLERSLAKEQLEEREDFSYYLEGVGYTFTKTTGTFSENQKEHPLATPTNFILSLEKESFDQLVTIGNQLTGFKEEMISELAEEGEQGELFRENYQALANLDALLTYTQLNFNWVDEKTLLIEDPHPQEIDEESYFG